MLTHWRTKASSYARKAKPNWVGAAAFAYPKLVKLLRGGKKPLRIPKKRMRLKRRSTNTMTLRRGFKKGKFRKTKFRGRKIKIGRKFRKKVKHIIDTTRPSVFYQVNTFDSHPIQGTASETQYYSTLPLSIGVGTGLQGFCFTPDEYLVIASEMFGRKTPQTTGTSITYNVAASDVVPAIGTKIFVKKSWHVMKFKNNFERTITIKLYVGKPKFTSTLTLDDGAQPSILNDTAYALTQGLVDVDGVVAPWNVSGSTLASYKLDPRSFKYVTQRWSIDCIKMTLSPGQMMKQVIKGPRDMVLDYKKFYSSNFASPTLNNFQSIQKFARNLAIIVYPEPTNYASELSPAVYQAGLPYYAGMFVPSGPQGLIVEHNRFHQICCPDTLISNAESLPHYAEQKVDKYYNVTIDTPAVEGTRVYTVENGGIILSSV